MDDDDDDDDDDETKEFALTKLASVRSLSKGPHFRYGAPEMQPVVECA